MVGQENNRGGSHNPKPRGPRSFARLCVYTLFFSFFVFSFVFLFFLFSLRSRCGCCVSGHATTITGHVNYVRRNSHVWRLRYFLIGVACHVKGWRSRCPRRDVGGESGSSVCAARCIVAGLFVTRRVVYRVTFRFCPRRGADRALCARSPKLRGEKLAEPVSFTARRPAAEVTRATSGGGRDRATCKCQHATHKNALSLISRSLSHWLARDHRRGGL